MREVENVFDLASLPVLHGPFLGIDWGKRHVGIAVSDKDVQIAMPWGESPAGGPLRHQLVTLWRDYNVQALVIGWPLHSNGQESHFCASIRRLAQRLYHDHGWPVALWDERLSSQGGLSMMPHTLYPHAQAAAFMLQGALNRWKMLISCPVTP